MEEKINNDAGGKRVELMFKVIIAALTLWAIPITKAVVTNHAKLNLGARFTAEEGKVHGNRITILETTLIGFGSSLEEIKQQAKENHDLILQLRGEVLTLQKITERNNGTYQQRR